MCHSGHVWDTFIEWQSESFTKIIANRTETSQRNVILTTMWWQTITVTFISCIEMRFRTQSIQPLQTCRESISASAYWRCRNTKYISILVTGSTFNCAMAAAMCCIGGKVRQNSLPNMTEHILLTHFTWKHRQADM